MHRLITILLISFLLWSEAACGQSTKESTARWVADLTVAYFNTGQVVFETVPGGGDYYSYRNRVFPALDFTYLRQRDIIGFGIGGSTNSVVQSLDLTYTLPNSTNDRVYRIEETFFRHMAGVHAALVFRQQDIEFGIRLGVYATVLQNECPEYINMDATLMNSQSGIRRARVIAKCSPVEQTLSKALTRFHLVYRINESLSIGVSAVNWGWRQNTQRRFYEFEYAFDADWGDGTTNPPKLIDVIFTEPSWQFGINLRWDVCAVRSNH
jgi:hypothetical protein